MSLSVAFQMDHIKSVDINADSTFVLALEALRRGHQLWHYLVSDMSMRGDRVTARAQRLEVRREEGRHYTLTPPETVELADLDVIMMRQDPPFDMAYITATHLLEHIHPRTLVVNDPVHVRNAPEKLFVTHFPDFMPPTLISSNPEEIRAFRREHGDLILKPLFGNGGAGVFHLAPEDENLGALLELFTDLFREPVIAQRYLPEIREGDKRIILVDGEVAGAINRVPKEGEARANMHAGGMPLQSGLDDRDRDICAPLGPVLRERGLIFVGIDVIGGFLTEINVTSPTGIQEIDRFDGVSLESTIWDAIEARYAATR